MCSLLRKLNLILRFKEFELCPKYLISALKMGRNGGERWAVGANALTSDVCEPAKSMFSERDECIDFFLMGLLGDFLRSHFNIWVLPHDLSKPLFTDN